MTLSRHVRAALTLLELIVVMSIMVVLATLALAVTRPGREDRLVTTAANRLEGWLLMARQQALRDRVPTGVRLLAGAGDDSRLVTTMQIVQQMEVFSGGTASVVASPDAEALYTVNFTGIDLSGGCSPDDSKQWPVQPRDYLELQGGGAVHRIDKVVSGSQLHVVTPFPRAVSPTAAYRIFRGPRPLAGMSPLRLPQGVVIDLDAAYSPYSLPNPLPDVMFTPAGPLEGRGVVTDKVILWLRDVSRGADGPQALVTVYAATGLIAVHPVDTTPDPDNPGRYLHPYSFTQDGRSSGL